MTPVCFHCAETIPSDINETIEWNNQKQTFCCIGCRSVAESIIDFGLGDYYKYRTDPSVRPDKLVPDELSNLEILDDKTVQQPFVKFSENRSTAELGVDGITCAACSWIIETRLSKENGVDRVTVNPVTQRLSVTWDDSVIRLSQIISSLVDIGYNAYPFQQSIHEKKLRKENRKYLMRLGVAGLGMMQVMMYALGIYIGDGEDLTQQQAHFLHVVSGLVATPVVFFSGFPFFRNAYFGLKINKLVMDVPVVIAISVAYVASIMATIANTGTVYFDSISMFIFFLLTGRYLEHRVRTKAIMATQTQRQSMPFSVTKIEGENTFAIPLNKIMPGDRVQVRAGDTVAVDGVILSGESSFDESLLTGEPLPVRHAIGDKILAGCINQTQTVEIETTAIGEKTYLAALEKMTSQAADARPELRKITDKVAHWFVLSILLIVAIVYSVWLKIDTDKAFWVALSVLVVSCPCALSLATPTALTTASMKLQKLGLLLFNQDALTYMSRVSTVAFDKTGTLTQGKLSLNAVHLASQINIDLEKDEVVNIIALLEQGQNHPIAKAFQHIDYNPQTKNLITNIKHCIGQGIEAKYKGQVIRFGSRSFCLEMITPKSINIDFSAIADTQDNIDLYLTIDDQWIAQVLLSDQVKFDSAITVANLKQAKINTMILSGDNSIRVSNLAKTLSIDKSYGRLLPQDKADKIKELQQNNETVMMVGDGLNDTVVLAQADIGIAIDTASDITRLNADAVLTSSHLSTIPVAIDLARETDKVIKQNLSWALGYNLIAIPFAAIGWVPPWLAAIGMTMSSIIVVLNALRLNRL